MRPAHIKERREKEVRAQRKRDKEIFLEMQSLGYKKLEKPIRHGWYKEVVLTVRLERYKSRLEIEEIFEKMKPQFWGKTKEECDRKWNNCVSDQFIVKDLPTISKKQFNKLSRKAQKLCVPYIYRKNRKRYTRFYIRFPKPSFRIKYTRAYITHSKIIDPQLESELDLSDQKMLKNGYYGLFRKGNSNYYWNYGKIVRESEKNAFKKELRGYANKDLKTISWERNSKGKI